MYREISIFDERDLPPAERAALGVRVLVMRRWPRGIRSELVDCWIPDAGPSAGLLLSLLQKEIDWSTFARRYREEQLLQTACRVTFYEQGTKRREQRAHSALQELRSLSQQYDLVTLMCWERGNDDMSPPRLETAVRPCHRHVLLEMLREDMPGG